MRTLRRSLLFLALAAPAALAQRGATALDRAASAWSRVQSARGTFEMTVTNSLLGSSAVSRAEFQQQRPNRVAIHFTDPRGDAIVADGKNIWIYQPSATPGQVLKRSVKEMGLTPVDLSQFLDKPRERFTVTDRAAERIGGRAVAVVVLIPRGGTTAPFSRATVWIDEQDATVRRLELQEGNGVSRRIEIMSLTPNAKVDAKAFSFSVPRGVKVIDRF